MRRSCCGDQFDISGMAIWVVASSGAKLPVSQFISNAFLSGEYLKTLGKKG
jgi:hypothetical protein